ncbi:hypothetical protein C8P64_0149 [Christiangramia gaetbulicola]|uniref:Uncharacterized protein n=1 Tax=Christiangramia gaetbulicola TaxID=703340 RepID=A0A2T6AK33_9FLAO|nr:hypothetical protein [Christiangramia gaetbulicola]PTX44179.1 hypothetical protein C8P64_0149 [Christiangramia gaetbulicola]
MKLKKILFRCVFVLMITGCETKDDQVPLEERAIGFEEIETGNLSYSREEAIPEQYLVFHTLDEWNSFLTNLKRRQIEEFEQIESLNFDFEANSIVFITAKFEELCCKSISIENVYKRKDTQIYVDFTIEGTGNQQVEMQPFKIIRISK